MAAGTNVSCTTAQCVSAGSILSRFRGVLASWLQIRMRNWQFDAFSPGSLTVPLSGIEVRGRVGEVRSASAANTKPPCSFVYLIKSTSTVAFWWLNQRLSATLPQNAGRALSGREYSPLSTSRPGRCCERSARKRSDALENDRHPLPAPNAEADQGVAPA